MLNKNILGKYFGVYNYKQGDLDLHDAVNIVKNKFAEIAKYLDVKIDSIYKLDNFGVPSTGFIPGILYGQDASKLKHIEPLTLPTTFFITGDSIDTKDLSKISSKYKKFNDMGMPNSHKLGQGLICKIIMDNPIYVDHKPLIPIGIDNYMFASPADVVKRLEVIMLYKKALESKLPKKYRKEFKKVLANNYTSEARKMTDYNREMVKEFARIFPNSLNVVLTIEPPSAITEAGSVLSVGKPLAVIQTEYGVHPSYFNLFEDFYYLYMSDDPINVNESFPSKTRGNILVGHLPYIDDFSHMNVVKPPRIKRIVLSSGGAAGRIKRMADEINKIKFNDSMEFLLLTGVNKNSKEFRFLTKRYKKAKNDNIRFTLVPKVPLHRVIEIYSKAHASVTITGTFSTYTGIISGKPFGAVIDTRKTKDRIFTDHMITNAIFARDVFDYPVVIINNKIKKHHLEKLLDTKFMMQAYKRASEKGGIRDIFNASKSKWRNVFIYFLK